MLRSSLPELTVSAAFDRLSSIDSSRKALNSTINYVRTTLRDRYDLQDLGRERCVPDGHVIMDLFSVPWGPELAMRVNFERLLWAASCHLQTASGGRIGEVIHTTTGGYQTPEVSFSQCT